MSSILPYSPVKMHKNANGQGTLGLCDGGRGWWHARGVRGCDGDIDFQKYSRFHKIPRCFPVVILKSFKKITMVTVAQQCRYFLYGESGVP